ncbi:amino acid permease-domain-containing protein [Russula aff. rugulosa BPL654]|nr:amino acid permease-domain-containing protein [Russula aff. rugulosa BPL654]
MSVEKDESSGPSLEKGIAARGDDRYHFDQSDLDRVQRRLKQRHVQMFVPLACLIAIAGTIGTGLFLGSGSALRGAGPLGALLAYALVGTVAYSSLCSLGEMTSLAPISGTFPYFAARWVQPSFGAAVGWNYFYAQAITTPVEVTAATILITYWDDNHKHQAGYTAVLCFLVCLTNIFGVRYFGESEFVFSIIKLTLITGLILCGLIIDLGGGPDHKRLGFTYWKHPGALNGPGLVKNKSTDNFLGWVSVLVQAGFSFQGVEFVAIAASETENPRRNIAKAVRRVFWRIIIFYILGILITGMLVPYDDPELLDGTSTAIQSPYVIAIRRAGIHTLPSIINAAIFTSAFLPAIRTCSARRVSCTDYPSEGKRLASSPWDSLHTGLKSRPKSSTGLSTSQHRWFLSWWSINLTYIRFWRGYKVQGLDRTQLVYWNPLQPGLAVWGVFWTSIFILVIGYQVFFVWNTQDFLTAYINIPIFFTLWIGWTVYMRTPFWRAHEMDFVTGIPSIEETDSPEKPPRNLGEKIFNIVF